jgi:hypothetical protein
LAQSVKIDLQSGEENEVVPFAVNNLKWPMPVFMVEANIENILIDERGNVQS